MPRGAYARKTPHAGTQALDLQAEWVPPPDTPPEEARWHGEAPVYPTQSPARFLTDDALGDLLVQALDGDASAVNRLVDSYAALRDEARNFVTAFDDWCQQKRGPGGSSPPRLRLTVRQLRAASGAQPEPPTAAQRSYRR